MIRSIIQSSMRFRPLVVAIAAVVLGVGIARLDDVPVDVFPEVMPPTVQIQTEALGLSAAEVEQLITVPMEADLLAGLAWLDVMRSESVPGCSYIELTFKPGTDLMDARQMVQERLTQAHALPNVSAPPFMLQPLSSTNRVMMIGLSSETMSLIEMSVHARWTIRPRLMGVPGVANVAIWGQRERQLQVQVDPEMLAQKHVTLFDVIKTAGNALWVSPLSFLESSVAGTGGFVETPNQRLGVRHVLPISSAADLAKVAVENEETTTALQLDEVAHVVEDHQPLIGDAMNGHGPGLMLVVEKLPGVNTLEVTDDVQEAIVALQPGLAGLEFDTQVYRPANYVHAAIGNAGKALLAALILVTVALLALTSSWRAALIALFTIPVSLMAAIFVIYTAGATVNAMVLAGLVIALGVVIDDGLLDADNFLRRLRRGSGHSTARTIVDAAFESRSAMMFATAIVLLAALPVLFMSGVPGEFAKPLALTYGLAVIASLVVATTVTPALGLMLLQKSSIGSNEPPFARWVQGRYEGRSGTSRAAFGVALVLTLVGVVMVPQMRLTIAPTFKEPDLMVQIDAPPGTSRPEMNRVIDRMSHELRSLPGVRNVGAHVGRAILSDRMVGISSGDLWVNLDRDADYEASVAAVEEVVHGYVGLDCDVSTYLRSQFGDALSGVDEPVVVALYGQQLDVLQREAEKVRDSIAGIPGIVDAHVELDPEEPVVEIKVDLEAAKKYGIKPGDVRRAAATLLSGLEVGNLYEEQKVFQVVVWGVPRVRHSLAAINDLLVDTPAGSHVRLGDVAAVRITSSPNVIRRENVARRIDVAANVHGRSIDAVTADVRDRVRQMQFPLEYRAELTGDFARQQAARSRVVVAGVAAVIGILLVLQASFGSWGLAFFMLLTLPMALAGGAIAAVLSGGDLSLGAFAGFLTLLGLAVRHGIMLVARYRQLRFEEGVEFGPELVRRGTQERAAQIWTSSIVTALAVLPFALFRNAPGHEILGPMALVILGGLVTSTLYALGVVPLLYGWLGTGVKLEEADIEEDLNGGHQIAV